MEIPSALHPSGNGCAGAQQLAGVFCLSLREKPTSAAWSGEGVPLNHHAKSTQISQTDYTYSGDFGLMDYKARFYNPTLGRFTQPEYQRKPVSLYSGRLSSILSSSKCCARNR